MKRASYQKHLGLILDKNRNFKERIDSAVSKVSKDISIIKKTEIKLAKKIFNYNIQSFFKVHH